MIDAKNVLAEFRQFEDGAFAELVAWQVPKPVRGSSYNFKYRFAFVVDGVCVLRYDNEAGKGDHGHVGKRRGYRVHQPQPIATTFLSGRRAMARRARRSW